MRRTVATFIVIILTLGSALAQSTSSIRINEILVKNVDNYIDDYGHRSSWIELHNTSHSTVDIGGCYLKAVAGGVETLYRIPTGDHRTKMEPLGYCVFFCEGNDTKGTMYTSFTMDNVEYLALLYASGKGDPIDERFIDYDSQLPDVSIGYMTLEDESVVFGQLPKTTPNATNDTEPVITRDERFRMMDPHGGLMALIAITVVLGVLTLLFLFFKLFGHYMVRVAHRKSVKSKAASAPAEPVVKQKTKSPVSAEEIAAITMALKKYTDHLHNTESAVLTINRVARAYSPWSSKIYGLSQFNKK